MELAALIDGELFVSPSETSSEFQFFTLLADDDAIVVSQIRQICPVIEG
jgi:hypothetical protein